MAFHGRDAELAVLLASVAEHRLITVTGPYGVGKSRLVAEALESLSGAYDRVSIQHLDAVPRGSDAASISGHLGLASTDGLALRLAAGDELLVLDGCDHVIAGTAELVAELLGAHATVSVVVVALAPLRLDEERVVVVSPLALPGPDDAEPASSPAVALFLERSRAVGAAWPDDAATLAVIADLCRELDGLPLAIELAASRSRLLSPGDLRAALRRKVDLLDSSSRGGGGGLRAALGEALDQLADDERRILCRLSVLPGSFEVDTAHAVAGTSSDVLDTVNALATLVECSLLQVETTASASRYRLLAVVREVAGDGLQASGDSEATGDRFADLMAATADRLVTDGLQHWSGEVVAAIAARITPLLAAVEWCVEHDATPDRSLRIYLPLFGGVHQSRSEEVRRSGERIFTRWPDTPAPLRAECLGVLATGAAVASDLVRAREIADRALADPRISGVGVVVANRALMLAALAGGDLDDAAARASAGEAAAIETGMHPFAQELVTFRASIEDRQGRPEEGLRRAVDVALDAEQSGDAVTELWARVVAANIAARQGDWTDVRRQVEAARVASTAAAVDGWTVRVFRSDALLACYAAMATAHLAGWSESVAEWRDAIGIAAAGGGALEVAITIRGAATVARRMGQASVADELDAAIPATREVDVLPEVFERDSRQRARPRLSVASAFHAALTALHSAGALGSLRPAGVPDSAAGQALMRRDGDTWEIAYGGATARVRQLKGIADLAVLVSRPNTEVHALELMGVVQISESTGPAIDDRARQSYRTQVLDLQEAIDDARAANDLARAERAEDELDALVAELSASLGLGGRTRETGSTAERARSAVTFRVRAAIKRIAEHHDALGKHLRNSVRTGTWCSYAPEQPVAWEVDSG